jgi:glycerate dehydrogenase
MRAVFLDWNSVDRQDLDRGWLKQLPLEWEFRPNTDTAQLRAILQDVDIVISNKVVLNGEVIRACNRLKLICVAATGTNNVDLQAANEQGIPVCNVRSYATPSVVQHVFMLMLNLMRRLPDYQNALARGQWQKSEFFCLLDYTIEELAGKTLGIVGYGELGKAVASMAKLFGMRVLVAQRLHGMPTTDRVPLAALLPKVDILSLHCPLTAQSKKLIGTEQFDLMKPGAILINTARGGIVDETALLEALQNGKLAGAGVDVLAEEPPVNGNPLLDNPLPNLIVTPHVAWASRQARQRLIQGVATNINGFLNGNLLNQVN